jgi:hypothetical protein
MSVLPSRTLSNATSALSTGGMLDLQPTVIQAVVRHLGLLGIDWIRGRVRGSERTGGSCPRGISPKVSLYTHTFHTSSFDVSPHRTQAHNYLTSRGASGICFVLHPGAHRRRLSQSRKRNMFTTDDHKESNLKVTCDALCTHSSGCTRTNASGMYDPKLQAAFP